MEGTVAELIQDLLQGLAPDASTFNPSARDDRADRVSPTLFSQEDESASDLLLQDTAQVADQTQSTQPDDTASPLDLLASADSPPSIDPFQQGDPKVWYLGLDLGTTGISAVLFNRSSHQVYPVYWSGDQGNESESLEAESTGDRRFRLPTGVTFIANTHDRSSTSSYASSNHPLWQRPIPVTIPDRLLYVNQPTSPSDAPALRIQDFKPYLKLGIPYYSAQTLQWEPVLQWSDTWQLPLAWVQRALQSLLTSLKQPESIHLTCGALGLDESAFHQALQSLSAVVVGYPAHWSDTYCFNVREAIVGARLVAQPDQVFFIEDAIATVLSVLRSVDDPELDIRSQEPGGEVVLHNADWQGHTLVFNAGATATEMALVNLPAQVQELTYSAFHLRSLPVAGHAIDQDIVCQLLYPLLLRPSTTNSISPTERIDLSLGAVQLEHLGLDQITFPIPGEPDLTSRYQLQQRLESARSGQILMEAARCLKLAFQQQSYFTLQLGDRCWTILRQDFGSKVVLPYVQRLNRELNALLQQTNIPAAAVNQVICTGGTASIGAIARWLRQKLPNAVIVQDTYARPAVLQDNCIPSCSRVAYGLAALPLHAHLLDTTRQHYNDYFLLLEILRHFPNHAVSLEDAMRILEQQGIDTTQCRSHILALLEGHLPPGLVPTPSEEILFTHDSLASSELRTVQVASLFQKEGDRYRPNRYQWNQLQRYLNAVLAHTHQKLTQPFRLTLGVET